MRIHISSRTARVCLTTALFLVLSLNPRAEPVASESEATPPSPDEVRVLEELRQWVRSGTPEDFRVVRKGDLASAIRSHRRSFELFRSYNDEGDRRRQLQQVPYGDLIGRVAQRHQVDGLLLAAVVEAESSFNPLAISPAGALGLMQVLPSTATLYGFADPTDPQVNVEVGARYLASLLRQFGGDIELALAAYNAGPGAVSRFQGVPPFRETRAYVKRVLSLYVDHHQELWESSGATEWLL